jgi:hypothetical protein
MAATRVISLRIDPELLEELRKAARAEGRSVSSQVVHLVRKELAARSRPRRKPLPTLGWLRHLGAPDELEEFRRVRRSLSRSLAARAGRRSRRR